jgi:hypothetical protein
MAFALPAGILRKRRRRYCRNNIAARGPQFTERIRCDGRESIKGQCKAVLAAFIGDCVMLMPLFRDNDRWYDLRTVGRCICNEARLPKR